MTAAPVAPRVLDYRAHAIFHDIITINLAHPKHLVDIGFIPREVRTPKTKVTSRTRCEVPDDTRPNPPACSEPPTTGAPSHNRNLTYQPNTPARDERHETPPIPWYEKMRRAVIEVLPHPPPGVGGARGRPPPSVMGTLLAGRPDTPSHGCSGQTGFHTSPSNDVTLIP